MKLKIKAFGVTREIIGAREVEIDFDRDIRVSDIRRILNERYPGMETLQSLFVAVNNAYADDSSVLAEHDEIALIPPVSGG